MAAGPGQTSEGPTAQASGPKAAAMAYSSLIGPGHCKLVHTYFAVSPRRTVSLIGQAMAAIGLKVGAWRRIGAGH